MTLKEIIGKRILERRLELNLSQQDLADKSGVGQGQISALENGTSLPSISTLNEIRVVLKTDFNYFFEDACGLNSFLSIDKQDLIMVYDNLNVKSRALLRKIAKLLENES